MKTMRLLLLAGIIMGLLLGPAQAEVTNTWLGGSGTFGDSGKWDLGVAPGTNHGLVFSSAETYTVTLGEDSEVLWAELYQSDADVTWDLGGRVFDLTGRAPSRFLNDNWRTSLHVWGGDLTISNGTLNALGITYGGGFTGGRLTLTGPETVVTTSDGYTINTITQAAEWLIINGAAVTNAGIRINGMLTVTGGQSRYTTSGRMQLGRRGAHSELFVKDGGHMQIDDLFWLGDLEAGSRLDIHLEGGTMALTHADGMDWIGSPRSGHTAEAERTLHYTLFAGAYDAPLTVTGTMTLGTNTVFNLTLDNEFDLALGEVYTVAQAGGWSGFFLDEDGNPISDGAVVASWESFFEGEFALRANYTSDDKFTLTVIPEPGSFALLLLVGAVGGLLHRRRAVGHAPKHM